MFLAGKSGLNNGLWQKRQTGRDEPVTHFTTRILQHFHFFIST